MKKHNGMRPLDILVLLKIVQLGSEAFYLKDLSHELGISLSEVSESINRSVLAGLLADDKKTVLKQRLLNFLIHGLPYVFPQRPGAIVPGIPTAHSALPLSKEFNTDELFVWPDAKGEVRGQQIEPYHIGQINAAKQNPQLYELLALTDALRVGHARERKRAGEELQKRLLQ